jgi:hypothetical protein
VTGLRLGSAAFGGSSVAIQIADPFRDALVLVASLLMSAYMVS